MVLEYTMVYTRNSLFGSPGLFRTGALTLNSTPKTCVLWHWDQCPKSGKSYLRLIPSSSLLNNLVSAFEWREKEIPRTCVRGRICQTLSFILRRFRCQWKHNIWGGFVGKNAWERPKLVGKSAAKPWKVVGKNAHPSSSCRYNQVLIRSLTMKEGHSSKKPQQWAAIIALSPSLIMALFRRVCDLLCYFAFLLYRQSHFSKMLLNSLPWLPHFFISSLLQLKWVFFYRQLCKFVF